METLNQINPINLILITAIVCFAIALVITLAVFFFMKKEETETPVVDRYVYPKKECGTDCACDCLGERKLEHNGELPDLFIGSDVPEFGTKEQWTSIILENSTKCKIDSVEIEQYEPYENEVVVLTEYMKRGNKRYYRGENVKVVVTVKD